MEEKTYPLRPKDGLVVEDDFDCPKCGARNYVFCFSIGYEGRFTCRACSYEGVEKVAFVRENA